MQRNKQTIVNKTEINNEPGDTIETTRNIKSIAAKNKKYQTKMVLRLSRLVQMNIMKHTKDIK